MRKGVTSTFIILIIITSFIHLSNSFSSSRRTTTTTLAQRGIHYYYYYFVSPNIVSWNKYYSIRVPRRSYSSTSVITMMTPNNNSLECTVARSTGLATFLKSNTDMMKVGFHPKQEQLQQPKFKIIMGNEAGDADSILSAITLAYVESLPNNPNGSHGGDQRLLPIASIVRQDISLRNDVNLLLHMVGIDKDHDLMYLDDDIFQTIVHDHNIKKSVVLVDHNKIRSDLWHLEGYVEEILDHHQDEGAHSDSVHDDLRDIAFEDNSATVGSTCTLIVERLMLYVQDDKKNIHDSVDTERMVDPGLGLALLGVILLDTMNMSEHAGKGTIRDQTAIDFLMDHVAWDSLNLEETIRSKIFSSSSDNEGGWIPNRERLFAMLQDSKFDPDFWQRMTARDALRIDYKRFETSPPKKNAFGLSSVLLSMEDLTSKPNFAQAAVSYMEEASINLLGVLTMVIQNDKPVRELLLIGDRDIVHNMTSYLMDNENASILDIRKSNDTTSQLETMDKDIIMMRLKQGNPKGSRKQVAPIMLSYYF